MRKWASMLMMSGLLLCTSCAEPSAPTTAKRSGGELSNFTGSVTISGPIGLMVGETGNFAATVEGVPTPYKRCWLFPMMHNCPLFGPDVNLSFDEPGIVSIPVYIMREGEGVVAQDSHPVEVFSHCNPYAVPPNPAYCFAKIAPLPDGAGPNELCEYYAETNMPVETTKFRWYVNAQLEDSGSTFSYSHPYNQSFELFMTAENPTYGGRNHTRQITVSSAHTCNL